MSIENKPDFLSQNQSQKYSAKPLNILPRLWYQSMAHKKYVLLRKNNEFGMGWAIIYGIFVDELCETRSNVLF